MAEDPDNPVNIPDYEGRETRTFSALNTETNKRYTVNAVHLAENDYCIVYGDPSAGISFETAKNIASGFEDGVYPVITDAFGDFREHLGDKNFGQYAKLTLLLMDIKDGYNSTTNSSYIAGYFYPGDMYNKKTLSYSNETALLYMDISPGNPKGDEFLSVVAHEFQHLINFSIRMKQQDGGLKVKPQNTWIDEGLASAAEYLYGKKQIQNKIDYFNDDKGNDFSGGDTFLTWDSQYEDYCTVYLFFQWLRIQADGKQEIYKDIINSKHLDYRAVTGAAAKHIDGQFDDWETLLSYWLLANHVNAAEGALGYNGEITTKIRAITGKRVSLAPGEGVFSYLDGNGFTPSDQPIGSHIRYLGVTQAGELISATGGVFPSGKTGRILTFNANTESKARSTQTDSKWSQEVAGISETGYLTGNAKPLPRTVEGARQAASAQGPYPIDIPPSFFLE
ncbi:MAG: hypothetical protein LBB98_01490 [Treponema sp.]|nr:hypothetical protein [Treponema sp.]